MDMKKKIVLKNEEKIYADISSLIESSKRKVQHAINNTMVMLYWAIGRLIMERASKSRLFRMVKFYKEFPN